MEGARAASAALHRFRRRPALDALRTLIESRRFEAAITVLIIINAITLGLETSPSVMARFGGVLTALDTAVLAVFVAELLARFVVYRTEFFRDPWRVFDFLVVAIALMPATGNLSVLRALRILRVLRLVSVVPSLRRVVGGLIAALPGMGSIVLLLGLVFYVFSVMATKLFAATFPEWFGTLGESAYSLFQIMTLESWSMGIVRPVMEVHPYSWLFFIPFIVLTSFAVLNLFIGIIVSAMQEEHESTASEERSAMQHEQELILSEIRSLRDEVRAMRADGKA
jgi:voltage-gated sodium channel